MVNGGADRGKVAALVIDLYTIDVLIVQTNRGQAFCLRQLVAPWMVAFQIGGRQFCFGSVWLVISIFILVVVIEHGFELVDCADFWGWLR